MLTYFYKVTDFEIYYIVKSNLNFKKYVKQLKQDYTNYKKNKTGYRYIFDLLESDNIQIFKYSVCYGNEEFANETYKEILNKI